MGLRHWIDDFVAASFLKFIRTDYKRRIDAALEGPDAFKAARKAPRMSLLGSTVTTAVATAVDEAPRALMAIAVEAFTMLSELHETLVALADSPAYVAECHKSVADVLAKLKAAFLHKFSGVLGQGQDKETLKLMFNDKFRLTVMTDPQFRRFAFEKASATTSSVTNSSDSALRLPSRNNIGAVLGKLGTSLGTNAGGGSGNGIGGGSGGAVSKDEREEQELFEENERLLEEPLYGGNRASEPTQPLRQEYLIFDSSALATLATLHDSLVCPFLVSPMCHRHVHLFLLMQLWLVNKVDAMDKGVSQGATKLGTFVNRKTVAKNVKQPQNKPAGVTNRALPDIIVLILLP